MSKVAIVGYGNVGYHLAKRISKKNHQVNVFSRNPLEKNQHSFSEINNEGFDFIILTVPDDYIEGTAGKINATGATILHTSGSRPMEDLATHKNYGVLYPLQTFSKSKVVNFDALQAFTEGSSSESEAQIKAFAQTLFSHVRPLSSQQRAKLHLAAVFACNFSNHMYHLAQKQLTEMGMKFQDLQPLVEETLKKAIEIDPSNAQTGPAVRKDHSTIQKHLTLLEDEKMRNMYKLITESIQDSE